MRPLETLHNNLCFKALNSFLTRMIERAPSSVIQKITEDHNQKQQQQQQQLDRFSCGSVATANAVSLDDVVSTLSVQQPELISEQIANECKSD